MKKQLLLIIFLLASTICYCQQLPGLSVIATKGVQDYMKRSLDSLRVLITKQIADSMATSLPIDGKTIINNNGKATAVAGDIKPALDSAGKVAANLTSINTKLTNDINIVSGRVTTVENKVTALENWRTGTTALLAKIDTEVATLTEQVKSIPKGAILENPQIKFQY